MAEETKDKAQKITVDFAKDEAIYNKIQKDAEGAERPVSQYLRIWLRTHYFTPGADKDSSANLAQ